MVSIVLDRSPSDHKPFIQTFQLPSRKRFTAVTYNVHHGARAKEMESIFAEIDSYGTTIWLLQEFKKKSGLEGLLNEMGFEVVTGEPEFAIAWDPTVWEFKWETTHQMSPTRYWTLNYALVAVLRHRETGERVKCMSYHPPAHVQVPKHHTFKKVSLVLRQFARTMHEIARRSGRGRQSKIVANLFGGDDNVDETRGYAPKGGWAFLNGPLKEIQPPDPTHGRKRRIDSFRVWGLKPIDR